MKKTFQKISLLLVAASMFLLVLSNFNLNVTKGGESLTQTGPSDLPEEETGESPTQTSSSDLPEEETGEVPPDLMVIPEVPMGTIVAIIACFFALMVSQRKHAAKLQ